MAKTAADVADKWASRAGSAQADYTTGVQNTQVDVVARAIQQQGVLLSNFTSAVTSGRWARALTESGGTANWKTKTVAKASNYGTGIAASKDKFQAVMGKLLPSIYALQAQVQQMPSGSIGDSKARANAWIDGMHAQKGQFKA
jgi:hypothetical protein